MALQPFDRFGSSSSQRMSHGVARVPSRPKSVKAQSRSYSFAGTTSSRNSPQKRIKLSPRSAKTMPQTRSFGFFTAGLEVILETTVPGTLFIEYPPHSARRTSRSKSSSILPTSTSYSVEFDPRCQPQSLLHAASLDRLPSPISTPATAQSSPSLSPVASTSRLPLNPQATIRDSSPTVTESPVECDNAAVLRENGIKVRDFAYSSRTTTVLPATEIWDPRLALGIYEWHMRYGQRKLPVPGKITSRLLKMGWITESEAEQRWKEMDWDELKAYESSKRASYPWRPFRQPDIELSSSGIPETLRETIFRSINHEGQWMEYSVRWARKMKEEDQAKLSQWEESQALQEEMEDIQVETPPPSAKSLGKRRADSSYDESSSPAKRTRTLPPELQRPKQFPAQPELNAAYRAAVRISVESLSQPNPSRSPAHSISDIHPSSQPAIERTPTPPFVAPTPAPQTRALGARAATLSSLLEVASGSNS